MPFDISPEKIETDNVEIATNDNGETVIIDKESGESVRVGPGGFDTDFTTHSTTLDANREIPADRGTVIAGSLEGDGEISGDGTVAIVGDNRGAVRNPVNKDVNVDGHNLDNIGSLHADYVDIDNGVADLDSVRSAESYGGTVAGDGVTVPVNGAWTIHSKPRSIYYNGTTYISWIDKNGDIGITAIDEETGDVEHEILHEQLQIDDHASPAIWIRDDGHIVIFYSEHDPSSDIFRRISTNPEDITAWDAEASIATGGYNQPVVLSNGDMWVFYRVAHDNDPTTWSYRVSTDGGETFGSETHLTQFPERTYIHPKVDSAGEQIHFAWGDWRSNTGQILHWYYDSTDQTIRTSDGTHVADEADLPLTDINNVTTAANFEDNVKLYDLALDSDDNPVVGFTRHVETGEGGTDGDYRAYWTKWDGSSWNVSNEVSEMGGPVPEEHYYESGLILDHNDPNTIYVSEELGDGNFQLFEYSTSDNGSTWTEEGQLDGRPNNKNFWPAYVWDNEGDRSVLWRTGKYIYFQHEGNYDNALHSDTGVIPGYKFKSGTEPTVTASSSGEEKTVFDNRISAGNSETFGVSSDDIIIRGTVAFTGSGTLGLRINGDSTTNYEYLAIDETGVSTATSDSFPLVTSSSGADVSFEYTVSNGSRRSSIQGNGGGWNFTNANLHRGYFDVQENITSIDILAIDDDLAFDSDPEYGLEIIERDR